MERVELTAEIPLDAQGERLDQVAARLFPDYSRSRLQGWIKSGELLLDGAEARTRDKVRPGQVITVGAEVEQPDLSVRHVGDRVDRVQDRVLHRGVNKISRKYSQYSEKPPL